MHIVDNKVFWFIARRLPWSWTASYAERCSFREAMKDPAVRAEMDKWVPVESPEGQRILSAITGETP